VLLDTLKNLVGLQNVSAVEPGRLNDRFQRGHLYGKLVNLITEVPARHMIADAQLKAIVSGDVINAEHKHEAPFEFQPYATCWFATNHMPQTVDHSDAIYRRAVVIPFNRVFAEHQQDRGLTKALREELPGILNLALEAFGQVLDRGYFTISASCEAEKKKWQIENDQVQQFINECCQPDPLEKAETKELYRSYVAWVKESGIKHSYSKGNLSKRLKELGYSPGHSGSKRYIQGIKLIKRVANF
jgi:putative DNA primase/helicase